MMDINTSPLFYKPKKLALARSWLWLNSAFILFTLITTIIFLTHTYPALNSFLQYGDTGDVAVLGIWDAKTYHNLASIIDGENFIAFALGNPGLLPPVMLLTLLGNNPINIFLFNILIFYASLFSYLKNCNRSISKKILLLILLNPYIAIVTLAINKEITAISSLLFLMSYIKSARKLYAFLAIMLSIFSRFELLFILIFFLTARRFTKTKNMHRHIAYLLIALTVILPQINFGIELHKTLQSDLSFGFLSILNELQNYYLYIVVFIPKAAITFFSGLVLLDFANYEFYSSALFFLLFVGILKSGTIDFNNDKIFLIAIYIIFFSAIAISHHRYMVPIFPILVIVYVERYAHVRQNKYKSMPTQDSPIIHLSSFKGTT